MRRYLRVRPRRRITPVNAVLGEGLRAENALGGKRHAEPPTCRARPRSATVACRRLQSVEMGFMARAGPPDHPERRLCWTPSCRARDAKSAVAIDHRSVSRRRRARQLSGGRRPAVSQRGRGHAPHPGARAPRGRGAVRAKGGRCRTDRGRARASRTLGPGARRTQGGAGLARRCGAACSPAHVALVRRAVARPAARAPARGDGAGLAVRPDARSLFLAAAPISGFFSIPGRRRRRGRRSCCRSRSQSSARRNSTAGERPRT